MFPKRGAIALVTTALALILLLSFKTPDATTAGNALLGGSTGGNTAAITGSAATPGVASSGSGSAASTPAATATQAPTAGATRAPTAKNETVTGQAVQNPYGVVEVQITVSNGKVTDIQAVSMPSRGRSGQISNYVEPILAKEALTAQSANIDIISGATYTSEAYAQSLQSALDQAGIAAAVAQVNG
jgi:uncharacterized protein with FMN-binding domain